MVAHLETKFATLADVMARVGHVPTHRVRVFPPPGTATEQDLFDPAVTGGRGFELVDGIPVEKSTDFRESLLTTWMTSRIGCYLDQHNLGALAGPRGPFRF